MVVLETVKQYRICFRLHVLPRSKRKPLMGIFHTGKSPRSRNRSISRSHSPDSHSYKQASTLISATSPVSRTAHLSHAARPATRIRQDIYPAPGQRQPDPTISLGRSGNQPAAIGSIEAYLAIRTDIKLVLHDTVVFTIGTGRIHARDIIP